MNTFLIAAALIANAGSTETAMAADDVTAMDVVKRSDEILRGGKGYSRVTMLFAQTAS
jgi:hypothetical protein